MLEEMASFKNDVNKSKVASSAYQTPPPKLTAPSPQDVKGKKKSGGAPPPPPPGSHHPIDTLRGPPAASIPSTEGAKLQHLRRLCELKPSGKCNVSEDIHLRWKNGTKSDREAMIEELESVEWSKETKNILQYILNIELLLNSI